MISQYDLTKYLLGSKTGNIFVFAGPCVIEDEDMAFNIASHLKKLCDERNIPFAFKGSYRKANRSRVDSFTGIGDEKALKILNEIRKELDVIVVTDIHSANEAEMAAEYVDILQIPAFLCRQTDLLQAAARTNKMVNIKKGQFLSPQSMAFAVEKIRQQGNNQVCVTDRGTFFGYQDLIVDMRAFPEMKNSCQCPVIIDCTHSLQQPNQQSGVTGGKPELISVIARSAVISGADGVFFETHHDPSKAKSDGANMLKLENAEKLLDQLTLVRTTFNNIEKDFKL